MASLPSNTFMFNYNAKQYNPTTHTISKTSGQLFDEDLVLNKAVASYTEDSLNFGSSKACMTKGYASTAENPFNRSDSDSFTFIYKVSGFTSHTENLLSNRDRWNGFNGLNYSLRGDGMVNSTEYYLRMTATTNPNIIVYRIDPTNSVYERKVVDISGNTLQSVTASSITWGQTSQGIGFFVGGSGAAASYEHFTKTFYWMYFSNEGLSDSEVLKVIKYNEGVSSLDISTNNINLSASGGTGTVDVSSENPWTASTTDNWIAISPTTGSTDATVTISVSNNIWGNRTGTVSFTDGEDSVVLTVTQKADTTVILKNIYRNGNKVPEMFRNGVKIYKMVTKPVFIVDTDSITFDHTGGTYTINITANDNWTMTIPNFVTASSLSGKSSESIIISTTGTTETKLDGNIVITMGNKSHTIAVEQNSAGPDLSTPLTFEILSDGEISLIKDNQLYRSYIKYKLNDGEWININNAYNEKICDVVSGDILQIKYNGTTSYQYNHFSSTCSFKLSGNLMSIITNDFESATTLTTNNVFSSLFSGCTGLTDASNLALPATTLVRGCYQEMFSNCTSLTTAPELPATTLADYCYRSMFQNCTNLNYIKCLATNISASNCTNGWVSGVQTTSGRFVKNPNMTSWTTGNNGIPTNWTVEDAT